MSEDEESLTEEQREFCATAAAKLAHLPAATATVIWYRVLASIHAETMNRERFIELLDQLITETLERPA